MIAKKEKKTQARSGYGGKVKSAEREGSGFKKAVVVSGGGSPKSVCRIEQA